MATYSDSAQRDLDCASGAAMDRRQPRFEQTYCSQCGNAFGPGDHGYSHCQDHRRPTIRELAEHYDGRVPQWYVEADDNERVVFCDACDGTGLDWCDGTCDCCDGTGYETITVEPIEIEDLPPC